VARRKFTPLAGHARVSAIAIGDLSIGDPPPSPPGPSWPLALALARAQVADEQQARRSLAGSMAGNEAKKRRAKRREAEYARLARALRGRHPDWTLTTMIAHLGKTARRHNAKAPSDSTIRRYLAAQGIK
jgi:hypothetical protein